MLNEYLNTEKSTEELAVPVLLEMNDIMGFARDLDQIVDSGELEELIEYDSAPVEMIMKNSIRLALYAAYISKVAGLLFGELNLSDEDFENLVETPAGEDIRRAIDGPNALEIEKLIEEIASALFNKD